MLPDAEHLAVRLIGHVPIGLFARAGHPLAGRRLSIDDLAPYPLTSGNSAFGERVGKFVVTVATDDFTALRGLMLDSDAVFLGGRGLLAGELARGEAVALDIEGWDQEPGGLVLVRTAGRTHGRAVRETMERLVALLAREVR